MRHPLVSFVFLFLALSVSAAQLTVKVEGQGYVDSYPSGILCGAACQENYDDGTQMTLTAHPQEGATFTGWQGCAAGGVTCTLTLAGDALVTAAFSGKSSAEYKLTVMRSGSGLGKIQSTDGAIFCGSICPYDDARFAAGTQVTLTATPNPSHRFHSWEGDCSGTQPTCTITMDADQKAIAVFGEKSAPEGEGETKTVDPTLPAGPTPKPVPPPPKPPTPPLRPQPGDFPLVVEVLGGISGSPGTVVSADQRVNCQGKCEVGYAANAQVPLQAVPAKWYKFSGWEGVCKGDQPSCTAPVQGGSIFFRPVTTVRALFVPLLAGVEVSVSGPGKVDDIYKISCPPFCAGNYPLPQGSVLLTASQGPGVIFEGWGGACQGTAKTCTVPLAEGSPAKVSASFKGPPPPPKLTVSVKGNGKDKLWMQVAGPSVPVSTPECTADCTYTYPRGTTVQFVAFPDAGSQLTGLGGACLGKKDDQVACSVFLDADKQVSADFSPRDFRTLTVVKPVFGEVDSLTVIRPSSGGDIHSGDNKIQCGNACSAEYDSFMKVTLQFKPGPDGEGVFVSGCDKVAEYFYGGAYCLVDLSKGNRTVETGPSPKQQEKIVREALLATFNYPYCPELKPLLESGLPLQKALVDYRANRTGKTIEDVKAWLGKQPSSWASEAGIQSVFDACDQRIVRDGLRSVFSTERQQTPALANFLTDPSKAPMACGLTLARAIPSAARNAAAFEPKLRNEKTRFYDSCGIKAFLDNWKAEEEERRRQEEAKRREEAERTPSISSISPDGWQIGNPALIVGGNFVNVSSVTLDGDYVQADVKSSSEIRLPTIAWGVDERGRKPSKPGRVKVTLQNGKSTEANLIFPAKAVTLHAEGKEEACFGGVGKACSGGGDEWDWKFGSDKLIVPVGCLPEKNGYRECWVVPGSIRHDNCCVRFPSGDMCAGTKHSTDGKPAEENNHDGHCVQEWDDAKWDVLWHRAWKHNFPVNRGAPDLTPAISSRYPEGETVTTLGLCAPKEHEMRQESDEVYCCSKRFRKGWLGEDTKKCA